MRHNLILVCLASSFSFILLSTVAFAGTVTSDEEISVSTTGGGIKVKSDNGNSFQIGGRIMYDYDNFDGLYNTDFGDDRDGDTGSESEFRRTRINVKGTSGKNWGYKMTLDIDEGEAEINTGYIKYKGFSFADVLVGRFKVPYGLEALTSSKWTTTIERAATIDLGFLTRQPTFGLGLMGHTDSLFWGFNIIDEDNEDRSGEDEYSIGGRLGGHFSVGENSFIHLAGSYMTRDFGDEAAQRFRTRLGVHATDRITVNDGESFGVDDAEQYGLEAAGVFGPFSLQAEYMGVSYDEGDEAVAGSGLNEAGQRISDVDVDGYYVQASYFLTGEQRGYKGEAGKFDKVKPKGPRGAWELVAKYEDGEVDADVLDDDAEYELLTLGVNWYPTNNVKFMLNYLDADTEGFSSTDGALLDTIGEEDGNAVSFRAQYAF